MSTEGKLSNTVVAGEASESDEDDVSTQNQMVAMSSQSKSGSKVIVSGEASESEDEEEIDTAKSDTIPPLNVNISEIGDKGDITNTAPLSPITDTFKETKPKYNTLLNKKLRLIVGPFSNIILVLIKSMSSFKDNVDYKGERNIALRRHIVDSVGHSYTLAGKDLHNITLQLLKTQMIVQDVSHNMRNITNDLFNLEDKVDIVTSCNLLPNIVLPSQETT